MFKKYSKFEGFTVLYHTESQTWAIECDQDNIIHDGFTHASKAIEYGLMLIKNLLSK